MSILELVESAKPHAPRITLYGVPGVGKSTVASQFPEPLFLRTEEVGIEGVAALPIAKTWDEAFQYITELAKAPDLPYKTIIIDSVSKLDALLVEYIVKNDPKANSLGSAAGGYGKGYELAQRYHRQFKKRCDHLALVRGIAIIFVCHVANTKHKSPDHDDYDRYSIVMNHDKSREVYIDDVDLVAFGRVKSFTDELDSGRIIVKSTNQRIYVTGLNDANVSKTRFKMPNEIPMTAKDLMKYIPFFNTQENLKDK